LVEHATENRSVGGSIPPLGTIPFPKTEAEILCSADAMTYGMQDDTAFVPGRRSR
jgi:hypothetical protein